MKKKKGTTLKRKGEFPWSKFWTGKHGGEELDSFFVAQF